MAECIKDSAELLADEFNELLETAKVVKPADNSFRTYTAGCVKNLKATQVDIKDNLIDSQLGKHSLPCGNNIMVANNFNKHLEDLNKQFTNEVIPNLRSSKESSLRLLEKTSLELNHQLHISKSMQHALTEHQNKDNPNLNLNVPKSVKFYKNEHDKVKMERKVLLNKLTGFIEENLPANHSAMNQNMPRIMRALHNSGETYTKLARFIQLLQKACDDSPQNPYVDITEFPVFPPYLELLLRNNIIKRHKQHFNLVRLSYIGS